MILQLKPKWIRDELIIVSAKGTKAGLKALQCAPSLWTRWKKHLMGDTVKSTERLSSGTRTTTQSQSPGLEWYVPAHCPLLGENWVLSREQVSCMAWVDISIHITALPYHSCLKLFLHSPSLVLKSIFINLLSVYLLLSDCLVAAKSEKS